MDTVQVVGVRDQERDGYTAVQLGAGSVKVKNVSAAMRAILRRRRYYQNAKLQNLGFRKMRC